MRRFLVPLLAMLAACSSGGEVSPPADVAVEVTSETAAPIDADLDTGNVPPVPDAGANETSVSHGLTTGKKCSTNAECDVTGEGVNVCSNTLASGGTYWPDPICVGVLCSSGMPCDGDRGICVPIVADTCAPACTFRGDGKPVVGCVGRAACSILALSKDASGGTGRGFCKPACRADAECKGGDKCQRELGICYSTGFSDYAKKIGDPCVKDGTEGCRCSARTVGATGYCTSMCVIGDVGACPAGFACTTGLEKVDRVDGSTLFPLDPPGLGGTCAKTCASDADCAAFGGRCDNLTSGRVCVTP